FHVRNSPVQAYLVSPHYDSIRTPDSEKVGSTTTRSVVERDDESSRHASVTRRFADRVRQRHEFFDLARYAVEAAGFPFRLGLFDAVAARGDEVPPDVARAVHGCAADEHAACRQGAVVGDGDRVSRAQHDEAAGGEAVLVDADFAVD